MYRRVAALAVAAQHGPATQRWRNAFGRSLRHEVPLQGRACIRELATLDVWGFKDMS